jgi:hypothetical protein
MENALPYKPPITERINVRMLVFGAVVLLMVGYPLYFYLDVALSGGVKDLGNGYKQVDLKAMSTFPFDQNNGSLEDVPPQWRALDDQKVVLFGEMWQPTSADSENVDTFELVYSIAKCCTSGPPQIQHFVHSKVIDGKKARYYDGQVKVTGTLNVEVKKEEGKVISIYQLLVEDVEPAW